MKVLDNINNFKADASGWIGSGIMFIFALIAGFRWHYTANIFFGLLIIRDLTASWFLFSINPNKGNYVSRFSEILAYLSSAFRFAYLNSYHSFPEAELISSILAIVGFSLSTLALFDLGSSFGVSPANRGIVQSGLYRYVRHPMYLGYAISELGFIFINPINVIIYFLSMSLYFLRTKLEIKVLKS